MMPMSEAHLAPAYVQQWQSKSWCRAVIIRCSLSPPVQQAGSSACTVISVSGDVAMSVCACTYLWPCCMLCIDSKHNSTKIVSVSDCHSGYTPGFLQGSPIPIFNLSTTSWKPMICTGSCNSILQELIRQLSSLRVFICYWVLIV